MVWSRVGIVYNDYQQHADASVHAVMMIVIKNGGDLADLLKAESERSKFKCFFIYYKKNEEALAIAASPLSFSMFFACRKCMEETAK